MNFLEKLDMMMEKYGFNKRTLSQHSGIPYTTIDAWYKKGYEGLKLTTLRKLSDYFNTSLDFWVLDEIADPNYGKSHGFAVDYSEMRFVESYRSLPASGRAHVDDVLHWELEHAAQVRCLQKESASADPSIVPSASGTAPDASDSAGRSGTPAADVSDLDPDAAAQELRDHADRKMRLVQEKKA